MTHTEVNHTYGRGFTLSGSKPPSYHKSNKQTETKQTLSWILPLLIGLSQTWLLYCSHLVSLPHLSLITQMQAMEGWRRTSGTTGPHPLLIHFHWPQSILLHIMISLVVWSDAMGIYDHYTSDFPSLFSYYKSPLSVFNTHTHTLSFWFYSPQLLLPPSFLAGQCANLI